MKVQNNSIFMGNDIQNARHSENANTKGNSGKAI